MNLKQSESNIASIYRGPLSNVEAT